MIFRITQKMVLVSSVALILIIAGCAETDSATEDDDVGQSETEDITFALSFYPTPEAAGWYVAQDRGWFEDENIDIEIVRGFGSGDTAQRVATGEVDFGIVDTSALVPLRINEDLSVVGLASLWTKLPQAIVFREDDGIEEPQDLEGKSIACSAGNAVMSMFPAFASATGIDPDAVEWKLSDPESIGPAFIGRQTDAACEFLTLLPVFQAQSDEKLDYYLFADHGVPAYGHLIVANENMIEDRPDVAERFLRAALAGYEYAIEEPEDALDVLLDHEPDIDADLGHEVWDLILDEGLLSTEDTEGNGFGYISAERMELTFDTLVEANDIDPGDVTPDELYTNELLP